MRFVRILICTIAVFSMTWLLSAGSQPKGNEGKGRFFFRQTCKECHTKGAKGGEVTPLTKTQAQWRAYFLRAKHAGGAEPLTKVMPDAQLLDVQTFLVNHAADSPQPETCGK
jgi:mono/diheme cytochrome c family protein